MRAGVREGTRSMWVKGNRGIVWLQGASLFTAGTNLNVGLTKLSTDKRAGACTGGEKEREGEAVHCAIVWK